LIPSFDTEEMKRLLEAVYKVSKQFSPEKTRSIALKIFQTPSIVTVNEMGSLVSSKAALLTLDALMEAWKKTNVSAGELAGMLLASSTAIQKATLEQSIELVWTGPTTPFASTRRTEQALLEVINGSTENIFITSFVSYDVESILMAINLACDRGVSVKILLELSLEQGGSVSIDGIGRMRALAPQAHLYAWREKTDVFAHGSVHAKVAVADEKVCFITSANLTGYAMEKNMEAGVLITGGDLPKLMHKHLQSLINVKIISSA